MLDAICVGSGVMEAGVSSPRKFAQDGSRRHGWAAAVGQLGGAPGCQSLRTTSPAPYPHENNVPSQYRYGLLPALTKLRNTQDFMSKWDWVSMELPQDITPTPWTTGQHSLSHFPLKGSAHRCG